VNAKEITTKDLKLKVLVYGKSGTGKTTFACTFPKPYVFDFDNGMLSQRGKSVEYDTFTNYAAFVQKLDTLEKQGGYETLVVDSVTTMQEYMMRDILQLNKRLEPTLHEWGRLVDGLQQLLGRMTKIAKHIVFVAHEQMIQDELTSEVWILPLIVGKKLPGQIPLWFDEVYRAQVGKKDGKAVYQLLTTADTKYTAKSRLACLETMEVPDYNVIVSKIK
jgi:hypothetical protein